MLNESLGEIYLQRRVDEIINKGADYERGRGIPSSTIIALNATLTYVHQGRHDREETLFKRKEKHENVQKKKRKKKRLVIK